MSTANLYWLIAANYFCMGSVYVAFAMHYYQH